MMAHPLLPKLRQLKLGGMAQTLDVRATQATQQQLTPDRVPGAAAGRRTGAPRPATPGAPPGPVRLRRAENLGPL